MLGYGLKDSKALQGNVSLKEVSITGNLCGEFVEISINQVYINNGDNNINCTYTFPIPDTAVITGFEAALGERTLKAVVEDKEEAKRIYEESNETKVNVLSLDQPNPNVFQFSIGQILPGESVKIKFSYMDSLTYEDNSLMLTIPSILYPRLADSDERNASIESSENYKSSLNLLIEPLSKVNIQSPSHKINVEWEEGNNLAKVTFNKYNTKLDRDFVLVLKEEKPEEAAGMIYKYEAYEQDKGILYLRVLPKLESNEEEKTNNYIFLIDISHSMKGTKLEQAKNALQLCIRNLSEGDSFNIVAFESSLHFFSDSGKVPFNDDNLRKATEWINSLQDKKGAQIFEALKYALSEKNDTGCSTILLFTDDVIEQEEAVLQYVRDNIGDNRIFTFGVDTSANSYVINKLAQLGYGKAEFIYEGERIEDVVLKQFRRIENPQVDIQEIDWGSMIVEKTYPRTIDYLYDREPFSIFARVAGEIEGKITIKGKVGDKDYIKTIDLDTLDLNENAELIQKVWSRKRIESIEERMKTERGEIYDSMRKKVIEISKEASIVSPETSFIMLEIIEDPVLGMPITHIVPLNVSEEARQNIARANFLDVPTFVYSPASAASNKEAAEKSDNYILDLNYPRRTILIVLAKNQFADGSFADISKDTMYSKLETTAMVLLAFTMGKDDIGIYMNQLTKSVKFLLKALDENKNWIDEKLLVKIGLALKSCMDKGILKEQLEEQCKNEISQISMSLYNSSVRERLLSSSERLKLRDIAPFLFKLSEDRKSIVESIVIKEEKDSIYSLAKLGLLKSI
ncbi:VWA domain-containing protein [Clostridium sp. SYSU_GA19001]|uniref:VIT domain-containing protein n=1 Tax=Clostridium caldaquaticum TaxID=2940653 RepID=UPI0020770FCA|nr:VIT domain-containing protein [Clostridium caldaquaticum]MCM8711146.1 VWA domain-containing protein [Clostridium caldaquaticum]